MQQHRMQGEMEEQQLTRTRPKPKAVEFEKSPILDRLKEANVRANKQHLSSPTSLKTELELNAKDKKIASLESELREAREVDALKDASLDILNNDLKDSKEREKHATSLLRESKKRVRGLVTEVERLKELESKMADSLVNRTNQVDATIFHLEESKIEILSLQEKIESLEQENFVIQKSCKETLALNEREVEKMKSKCQIAIEAEEKSTKAMHDLALALKEVTTESSRVKEKLKATQNQLDNVRVEDEYLKKMVCESKQESELHKSMIHKLRLEAEETLLALNGKEIGFVNCIKLAEEDKAIAQRESHRLSESLKAAENMTRASREETYKLRDILKKTVNDSNSAKAAATTARDENFHLKDSLSEKEERLHFLTKENERLRISEAACNENMKHLRILLSRGYSGDLRNEECYNIEEGNLKEEIFNKMMNKNFSFNLQDLKFMTEPEEVVLDEDPVKAEALKGSIFDANAETPKAEPRTPKSARLRGGVEDGKMGKRAEDSELESEMDRVAHRRAKTMLQRVGDLLAIRRNGHRKEASTPVIVEHTVATPST